MNCAIPPTSNLYTLSFRFPQDLLESGIIVGIYQYSLRFENCDDIQQVTTRQVIHQQPHRYFKYLLEGWRIG
jgi:hypothetical protein